METKNNLNDKKNNLERAQGLVDGLEIKHGVTIDELKDIVAQFIEEEIFLEPATLPASVSGFSVKSQFGPFVVFYDKFRHNKVKNLVITHELAHLLKGDAEYIESCDPNEAFEEVIAGKQSLNILCRSDYSQNPEAEKQIELIGTLLLQKVTINEMVNNYEITLTGLKDL